ncbi:hypothetical protein ACHAQA_005404 [Verticillium albo-atrum]
MAPQKRTRDAKEDGASSAPHKKHRSGFKVGPDNLPDGPWKRQLTKKKERLIANAKVKKAYAKIKKRELATSVPSKPLPALHENDAPPAEKAVAASPGPNEEQQAQPAASAASPPPSAAAPTPVDEPAPAAAAAPASPDEDPAFHPDRQAMLDNDGEAPNPNEIRIAAAAATDASKAADPTAPASGVRGQGAYFNPKRRGHKPGYYEKQLAQAETRRAEAAARTAEIERRNQERERKVADRERYRRAMAKARRGGENGQRKLGRESGLLLEKVRRLTGA